MKKYIELEHLTIGKGRPKVCVPLCAGTKEELLSELEKANQSPADLYEWRMDYLAAFKERPFSEAQKELAEALGVIKGNIKDSRPLLCTFRSKREGGEAGLSSDEYEKLLCFLAEDSFVRLLDVEILFFDHDMERMKRLIAGLHEKDCFVVASSHDFQKTPDNACMWDRMQRMEDCGADAAKLAVMPQCEEDVLRLLTVTREAKQQLAIPVITMSMGKMGMLSRLSGTLTGSCLTFGSAGRTSAPGQFDAGMLQKILELLEE